MNTPNETSTETSTNPAEKVASVQLPSARENAPASCGDSSSESMLPVTIYPNQLTKDVYVIINTKGDVFPLSRQYYKQLDRLCQGGLWTNQEILALPSKELIEVIIYAPLLYQLRLSYDAFRTWYDSIVSMLNDEEIMLTCGIFIMLNRLTYEEAKSLSSKQRSDMSRLLEIALSRQFTYEEVAAKIEQPSIQSKIASIREADVLFLMKPSKLSIENFQYYQIPGLTIEAILALSEKEYKDRKMNAYSHAESQERQAETAAVGYSTSFAFVAGARSTPTEVSRERCSSVFYQAASQATSHEEGASHQASGLDLTSPGKWY